MHLILVSLWLVFYDLSYKSWTTNLRNGSYDITIEILSTNIKISSLYNLFTIVFILENGLILRVCVNIYIFFPPLPFPLTCFVLQLSSCTCNEIFNSQLDMNAAFIDVSLTLWMVERWLSLNTTTSWSQKQPSEVYTFWIMAAYILLFYSFSFSPLHVI